MSTPNPRSSARRLTITRLIAITLIVIVALGLSWLRFAPDSGPTTSSADVPSGARAGDLTMKPCTYPTDAGSSKADCGTLVVPENRENPTSRLITLPVVRIRAQSAHPREPIFRFAGGPGRTNLSFPEGSRYTADHDVVLVGYRGVDGSERLDCPEVTSALKRAGDLLSAATMRSYSDGFRTCAQRLQRSGVDLDGYSLPQRIDDMEAARTGLGYGPVNLISDSAGTRSALIYSWRYPASVHRSVMVGVNPPGHFIWDPKTTDGQIAQFSALCATDTSCGRRTSDLAASMRQTSSSLPTRWYGLKIKPGNVRLATFFGLVHSTPAAAPLSSPMTLRTWISAANGDPSGMWLLSLLADVMLPNSHVWGEEAATGMQDVDATDAYYANPTAGTILGNPASDHLTGGGGLTRAWPAKKADHDYNQVRPSNTQTLLIGGNLDLATPAQNATRDLLPYLPNGHQLVLSGLGHTDDFWTYEEPAGNRLITTYFDTGRVDASLYTANTVNFDPAVTQTEIAKILAGTMVGFAALAVISLLLMLWRVRRVGGFGSKAGIALRVLLTPVIGLGGWFLGALTMLVAVPAVSIDNHLLVVLSVGLSSGPGIYLSWVRRDTPAATRTLGRWAALGGALVGATLGSYATDGVPAVLTAVVGAVAFANLAVIVVAIWLFDASKPEAPAAEPPLSSPRAKVPAVS